MKKLKGVLEDFGSFIAYQKTLFYIINWQKGGFDYFPLYLKADFGLSPIHIVPHTSEKFKLEL